MYVRKDVAGDVVPVVTYYIHLKYGDPKIARLIPPRIAHKHWREETERLFLKEVGEIFDRHINSCRESHEKKQEIGIKKGWKREPFDEERLRSFCVKETEKMLRAMRGERGLLNSTGDEYKCRPPYLPARVVSENDRNILIKSCIEEIEKGIDYTSYPKGHPVKNATILASACYALIDPKNHIKIRDESIEREPGKRAISDMINEMAQELANLPRYTAYAKVLQEKNGVQSVVKEKVQTLRFDVPKPEPKAKAQLCELFLDLAAKNSLEAGYYKSRNDIEKEIRQRQQSGRGVASDEPPPTRA
jgi:hypothetical protein